MAVRGKKGAASKQKAKVAKAGKAKVSKAEKKVAKAAGKAKKVVEAEAAEASEAEEKEDTKVEETAIAVAKDAPAQKGKKHKTKAHRIEEAVKKAEAEESDGDGETSVKGVLYLGHIPFGFGEPQMRKYFNQFGTVLRLRLSRSKSNAASKGYAFIEFEEREVAKIVAQTMDGYMMFQKKLVCHVMDPEKVHPRLFKGWNRIMTNWTRMRGLQNRKNYNDRPQVEVDGEKVSRTTCQQVQRRQKENKKLQALLESLDVDYDLSAFSLPDSPKVKAALSPKLKAGAPPAPGKRKRDAAEAEEKAAELVAEDKEEAKAASAQASPATDVSEKKGRHRRRRGPPAVIQDAKAAPKKKAASEGAAPKKKAAKTK